ncbi:T9SS type A sorting domain-containing protein [Winogradskyella sp. PG-2]|uniref:T9SS type A sorting domain-containing protein n=1 Tax=Winogradskyella sp. PG-2 TaxID=754409 RepID=UPI000458924F|nr:T9SS type A sorting domain-containing protein [Winogradskyella sp. PG-2]BAO77501.1 hypothetical protein WPG_3271 [Winogradskyella sp. PG-2]
MKRTLLTLLSIFCIATTVYSQTVWEDKVAIDTDTGNNPYTIANGLIDGDSNLDILVGTDEDNVIVWYKGNGDGTFVEQAAITNTLINIGGIKLVDLNSDGDVDILAGGFGSYAGGTYGVGSKLVWFAGDGTGGFGTEQLITDAYDGLSGLFVGTIDTGATPDISITSSVDNEVLWFSNDGTGSFTLETSIDNTLSSPGVINMKDIDGDGDLDALVATAVYAGDVIEIFRNDLIPGGSVAFAKDATSVATGKLGIFNANFEDLDGDTNLDILATEISYGGAPSSGNLLWYEEDGVGGYTETVFTTATDNPAVAQAKDLDNDGLLDIILSSGALADVTDLSWFKNNGDGTFGAEQVINDTQSQVYVYNVADFDGDLDMDIASAAYGADNLNYIENLFETLSSEDFEISSVKIYPNPTKAILNFEGLNTSTIDISVFNILGKKVLSTTLGLNKSLDVSQLKSGVYLITINNQVNKKFIKE